MIDATLGAELCSTHSYPNPLPSDCVKAFDYTYKGKIDLSNRVVVGVPVEKSPLQWSVPYNVVDDAGNHASTAWRDVVVEEVDIGDLEERIRREVMAARKVDIEEAVKLALADERSKNKNASPTSTSRVGCPVCPKCPQCKEARLEAEKECASYCDAKHPGTCKNVVVDFWAQFDGNNPLVNLMVLGCFIVVLRFMITLWFNPGALIGRTNYDYVTTVAPIVPGTTSTPSTPAMQGAFVPPSRGPSYSDPLYGEVVREPAPIHGGLFSPMSSRLYRTYDNGNLAPSSSDSPYRSFNPDVVDIYADSVMPGETGDFRSGRR